MTDLTRRTTLYGIAAGSAAALAGCTEAGVPADENGTDGGDGGDSGGDGNDGTDGEDGVDGDAEGVTTAVQQVGAALSGPSWDRTERRGFCVLITEEGDASWLLGEAPEAARAFVAETDFAESVVLYVESVGPDTCHDEIAFDGVAVEDGTLAADATVRGAESDDVACGEAVTYSAALLRVTSDPRPDAARLSVTDGWGETGTVRDGDGIRDPEGLAGGIRPDHEPSTVPAGFDCDTEGFERHPQGYDGDVNWGGGGGAGSDAGGDGPLALRVVVPGDDDPGSDPLAIGRGTRFRIELTNVSGRVEYVGTRGKYNLELRTEDGWTELRGTDGDATFGYTDEAIGVPPGESLEWEFEMTESGLVEGGPHADALRVCPDLVRGRYRFVFFGAADLAVAFDYEG
ncbi:hypothetical protein C465_07656 [Halorubrum distributum JCM 9100]|uniref:Uncharacterized protein n=3 Tax=Halorubrum distributum TaxID=29283 RepID=M0ENZ3_9EURY|nr:MULTISPECIES: hypothetical protein [Halorubrum distributum group]ELZ49430.1 hypothetical protein C465_07656 [Halorubrum distributum JCM 9100]ELZ57128.1 hypothetical protein C466_02074 [Halorubrum distributum JCM 10118]MYL67264.1 hypothetical protein [Halorubrum terrestre]